MNTPIIKISDYQNEITHESGFVSMFVELNNETCIHCVYINDDGSCLCVPAPCNTFIRNDRKLGYFIPKP